MDIEAIDSGLPQRDTVVSSTATYDFVGRARRLPIVKLKGVGEFQVARASNDKMVLYGRSGSLGAEHSGELLGVSVRMRIERVVRVDNERDYIFVTVSSMAGSLDTHLARFAFLQMGESTIRDLHRQGITVGAASRAMVFSTGPDSTDYLKVLQLRRRCYSRVGKVSKNTSLDEMMDEFDQDSILITGKHYERVAASIRVRCYERGDIAEFDQNVSRPEGFPEEFACFARACVDDSYRGSDVLKKLFEKAVVETIRQKKKYVVACSTEELWPMYERLGFKKTGESYPHPQLEGQRVLLIVQNLEDVLLGRAVNPIVWNYIVYDIIEQAVSEGIYQPVRSLRLLAYRGMRYLIQPLLNFRASLAESRRVARLSEAT